MATESVSVASVNVGQRSRIGATVLILLGGILALAGVLVTTGYFVVPLLFGSSGSFLLVVASYSAINATSSLLSGVGGFFIFLGFAYLRPDSKPWTLVAAVLVIAAGVTGAVAGGTMAFLWLNEAFRGSFFSDPLYPLLSYVEFGTGIARGLAFVIGLLAIGRTLIRRP